MASACPELVEGSQALHPSRVSRDPPRSSSSVRLENRKAEARSTKHETRTKPEFPNDRNSEQPRLRRPAGKDTVPRLSPLALLAVSLLNLLRTGAFQPS
jgi:hypothetical protein